MRKDKTHNQIPTNICTTYDAQIGKNMVGKCREYSKGADLIK